MCAPDLNALLSQWLNAGGGVLELPEGSAADAVDRILAPMGFDLHVADLAGVKDKRGLLERLHVAMGFDEWFGFNWDALEEALHGPDDPGAPERVLVLTGFGELRERMPDDADILLDILRSVAQTPGSGLRGSVLVP